MTGGGLLALMLLVSSASLVLQAGAFLHLRRQQAATDAERLAGRGYVRTAACRVIAASVYVTVAALQADGVRINGAGGLTPEALIIFSAIQLLWLANAGLDIVIRRKLRRRAAGNGGTDGR